MERRRLVLALAAMCAAPCVYAQPGKVYRVGILDYGSEAARTGWWKALHVRLRELGYVEGKNLQVESRFAGGSMERLPALADELVARKVDAIVVAGSAAAAAAKRATATIPIVTTTGPDPVRLGLAQSFARPGGNVTGLTSITSDLSGKRLELIRTLLPKASRVGVVFDAQSRASQLSATETEAAARPLEMTILKRPARDVADVETAFKEMRDARADVVIAAGSPRAPSGIACRRSREGRSTSRRGFCSGTGPTIRIFSGAPPTTWTGFSRAPGPATCRSNGLEVRAGHQPEDREIAGYRRSLGPGVPRRPPHTVALLAWFA